MAARVTIKGLDELRDELDELRKAMRRGGERAVREEVREIAQDMRDHAAVGDPSRGERGDPPLADSIVTDVDGLRGKAGSRAPHGPFVEHGTSTRPPDPFALPAAERARRRFPDRVAAEIRREIQ